jgi:hypothetical protein
MIISTLSTVGFPTAHKVKELTFIKVGETAEDN